MWDDLWCNTTSQGSCIPTVFQWKPCRDLERQCDVTLPTPRTSFSFTPQFGISLFSCFSSPPYSPVALCVFNRIFSPKKKIFSPYLPKYCFRCHAAGQPSFSLKLTCLFFRSFKTLLRLRELKGWLSWLKSALHYSIHWPKTPSHTVHRFCDPQGTTHGIN